MHFPDPDGATRRRLWRDPPRPARARSTRPIRSTLDRLAAAVELTGGDIRNIVVAAGYDAAVEGARPGMRHILVAATVGEYPKLGRRVPAGVARARARPAAPRT